MVHGYWEMRMEIRQEIYVWFADYIFKNFGILYTEKDYYRLDNRLKRLCEELNISDVETLYKEFQNGVGHAMHDAIIKVATNNETYFFRDDKPFQTLVKSIIPNMIESKIYPELNVWSVACSSGQEPCSIAMSIHEHHPSLFPNFKIDACDISHSVIERAKKGHYTETELQRGLSPALRKKYFSPTEIKGEEKVNTEILNKINYSIFNLMNGQYPVKKYDIIFCRNVLIYQDKNNREIILNKLASSLKDHGVLIMGSGESLIGLNVSLRQKMINGSMCFERNDQPLKVAA